MSNPFAFEGADGTVGTPLDSISRVLDRHVETKFGYKTFGARDLLYSGLHVTRELDVRAGAGLAVLGYSDGDKESVTGVVAPSYALPYFYTALSGFSPSDRGRLLFNVGALNYDGSALTNDYVTALDTAQKLSLGVVTPINTAESHSTALLSIALAQLTASRGAVHLFDGLNYTKTVSTDLVSPDYAKQAELLHNLVKLLPDTHNNSFEQVLDKFNELSGLKIHNFHGENLENAETIFVTYGSLESELFLNLAKQKNIGPVGVIAVRVPLPFNIEKFVALLPSSAKRVVVIGQSLSGESPSLLKSKVSAALFYSNRRNVQVSEYLYKPDFVWSPCAVNQIVESFSPVKVPLNQIDDSKSFIYWASDKSVNVDLASKFALSLSLSSNNHVYYRAKYDNINRAGTFQAQIVSSTGPRPILSNIDAANIAIVEDAAILKYYDVTATLKDNGTVLVATSKSFKDLDFEKVETYQDSLKLPVQFLNNVGKKNLRVIAIDKSIFENESTVGYVLQGLIWNVLSKGAVESRIQDIWNTASPEDKGGAAEFAETILKGIEASSKEIPSSLYKEFAVLSEPVKEEEDEEEKETVELPAFPIETSFTPNNAAAPLYPEAQTSSSSDLAKILAFKESYGVSSDLRPDLPVKNFVVKVKENRRVTPADYDRYIFHIEFDISGTGLTYDIGEALGIHARNNEQQVREFLQYYGLNENDIVYVPNRDNQNILEATSVLHAFVDKLDIFGKPPKKFYESLIPFTTDEEEKKKLKKVTTPAGAVDLKKFQDVEYYTYADIFELFPSARPPLDELVTIISPLKRREYSIASSQKMHPNEVHLLIVVVDWVDNKGRKRFGQASKYISDLAVGSELVVSVKPSVMKLPPSPQQPVIMSGLGTGLAPFKAIVEEKLWQKQQGQEIGDVYLFLGSRHKREEYLYGELWEAYKDAGIITHIGAAFSRDQPEKIYIQDRIRESLSSLKSAMIDKNGSFYLCGPTWPVPDITQALQDIYATDAKERGVAVDLEEIIEELKETSRYILEVY
ncbi:Sulfite reductase [NADPH] flavoprotein component [Nakaseomyces bracarensis]|uniref:Sulfite reductase [NADPH] flavoprotein component n=1 Tax=Nakaseomyces bracarensis TaxID=273131 RepID=A0ABR4P0L4_9SACH